MTNNWTWATFVLLVGAALVYLQSQLYNDVEDNPNNQDPGGPPWYTNLAEVHADEDVRDWKI